MKWWAPNLSGMLDMSQVCTGALSTQITLSRADKPLQQAIATMTYPRICQGICTGIMASEGLLLLQTGEAWNRCVRPKAIGSWNLDAASRGLRHLDHFVFFSSIVATQGNAGEWTGSLCPARLA